MSNTLWEIKNKFLEERTEESLQKVLECLQSAEVVVPQVKSNIDEKNLVPDLFKNQKDDLFFPIFSREEELPKDYRKLVEIAKYPATKCIEMAKADCSVKCLVLDPFTDAMVIPYTIAGLIIEDFEHLIEEEEDLF